MIISRAFGDIFNLAQTAIHILPAKAVFLQTQVYCSESLLSCHSAPERMNCHLIFLRCFCLLSRNWIYRMIERQSRCLYYRIGCSFEADDVELSPDFSLSVVVDFCAKVVSDSFFVAATFADCVAVSAVALFESSFLSSPQPVSIQALNTNAAKTIMILLIKVTSVTSCL